MGGIMYGGVGLSTREALAFAAGAGAFLLWERLRHTVRSKRRVKLLYFDAPGLGESIRLTLALAGVSFEDFRFVNRDEFLALKPSLKYGQVPALQVDGEELVQSSAILRYVATELAPSTSLYPPSATVRCTIDGVLDQVKDMLTGLTVATYRERFGFAESLFSVEAMETVKAYWKKETLPRHLAALEAALQQGGTGWVAGTPTPTIADVMLASLLKNSAWADALPPNGELAQLTARLYALPAVAAFKAAEKK